MAGKGNRLKEVSKEAQPEEEIVDAKPEKKKSQKQKEAKKPKGNRFLEFIRDERTHKISGLMLIVVAAFLLIAFISYFFTWRNDQSYVTGSWFDLMRYSDYRVDNWLGKIGAIVSHQFMHQWFGLTSFAFVLLSFIAGFRILFQVSLLPGRKTFNYSLFTLLYISPVLSFIFQNKSELLFMGGGLGFEINKWLILSLGNAGTGILLGFVGLAFAVIIFNLEFKLPSRKIKAESAEQNIDPVIAGNRFRDEEMELSPEVDLPLEIPDIHSHRDEIQALMQEVEDTAAADAVDMNIEIVTAPPPSKPAELLMDITMDEPEMAVEETPDEEAADVDSVVSEKEVDLVEQLGEYDPKLDLSSYQYPVLDLLENYQSSRSQMSRDDLMAELEANKKKIIETLGHYDIEIDKIKATVGPTVTLFEIVPKAGIRISKIKNLEDDIALSLAALGIRIIAPIPGKGTIGIEVPNQHPDIVSMKSVMASEKFQNCDMDLPIGLGKTISNEVFVTDLAKMPHLLMAGATGQGKSVGLNAILVSLLYKKHPAQVKFVLVDPKKVELTLFKTIERHFLAKLPGEEDAIITDTKKVVATLNSLCVEMDQRYELLKDAQVRNIREYNTKFINRKLNPNNGHRYLPFIVLVVDEFADLIMTAGKEVETPIARLAQLARAIGIHLIIATQRPSVNIITGTIKANFPARLAFRVTSKIDSRTILDTGGADQLIGRGDMLLSTGSDLVRIQCAFVDTKEVDDITQFIGNQRGYPDAHLLPEYVSPDGEGGSGNDFEASDLDPLFDEAAHMVVQFQQGSASLLQRRLKLGYNRAGRLVDQLEAAGIIGPFEGSKAREVRCKDMASLEQLLKGMNSPSGV
jgi:S-DNA-T family DNA segregation ATPase FtsK/SpoIIIE